MFQQEHVECWEWPFDEDADPSTIGSVIDIAVWRAWPVPEPMGPETVHLKVAPAGPPALPELGGLMSALVTALVIGCAAAAGFGLSQVAGLLLTIA